MDRILRISFNIVEQHYNHAGKNLTQYNVLVKNTDFENAKASVVIDATGPIRHLWNLQGSLTQNKFELPAWLPEGLWPNGQFTFGFVCEGTATVKAHERLTEK